ncbi:YihA family ribosome biogenesis GTP-binding protein [Candidatus Pantoea edessiphila]|uniref:Probable GTP-binding protein EngB n=1 Tax=Candidatus Pantoea edessiphila TaxID=2044610 RepID=A0A2P5T1K7_9GAMM|nr:ribosome biogenesis GTP-binding protein YihA/YsxC [Candidatus Pantoea edessiphila]PPI88430.1 YihA family ribosome biogenesis GTP-binding protein [Candidatus Pantoea edessiphila]
MINYQNTRFIVSVPNINYLPINNDDSIEVALIGRSNSGKSSLLNKITNQNHLARVSKTPGCTKLINLFEITQNKYLVDLPGYGYAKTSKKNITKWNDIIFEYIKKNRHLKGLILLMDIRYTVNNFDKKIIKLTKKQNISLFILLTKADKCNFSEQKTKLNITKTALSKFMVDFEFEIEIFSSLKNINIDKIYQRLNLWFN